MSLRSDLIQIRRDFNKVVADLGDLLINYPDEAPMIKYHPPGHAKDDHMTDFGDYMISHVLVNRVGPEFLKYLERLIAGAPKRRKKNASTSNRKNIRVHNEPERPTVSSPTSDKPARKVRKGSLPSSGRGNVPVSDPPAGCSTKADTSKQRVRKAKKAGTDKVITNRNKPGDKGPAVSDRRGTPVRKKGRPRKGTNLS